jgi:hypothetical protein
VQSFQRTADEAANLAQFLSEEDIIAKIHAIQTAEHQSPYRPYSLSNDYWTRTQRALQYLPVEYRHAALALFASVIYVTDDLRRSTARYLASAIAEWASNRNIAIPSDVHVFAVDHQSLVEQLYSVGSAYGWGARMDQKVQLSYPTTSFFLKLIQQTLETTSSRDDFLAVPDIQALLSKKLWVVLNDNALSGGSATSDARRLMTILGALRLNDRPQLVVAAQIITEQAVTAVQTSLRIPREDVFCGLYIDESLRIVSDECALFESQELLHQVRLLCHWFGKHHFSFDLDPSSSGQGHHDDQPDSRLRTVYAGMKSTVELHRRKGGDPDFSFGWLDGGYTIVDRENCPSNSVPILWYPADVSPAVTAAQGLYPPPFPRNHSRKTQVTAGDSERVDWIVAELQRRFTQNIGGA